MAHHKSAIKRIKTSRKAYDRNRQYRTMMRTAIRRVREAENAESRKENLSHAFSVLDRLVVKGILHRNTASRRKSRLNTFVNTQSA